MHLQSLFSRFWVREAIDATWPRLRSCIYHKAYFESLKTLNPLQSATTNVHNRRFWQHGGCSELSTNQYPFSWFINKIVLMEPVKQNRNSSFVCCVLSMFVRGTMQNWIIQLKTDKCNMCFFDNSVTCKTSLICIWTSIVVLYKTCYRKFQKQIAFVFKWTHLKAKAVCYYKV
jgi:hypothetical protein